MGRTCILLVARNSCGFMSTSTNGHDQAASTNHESLMPTNTGSVSSRTPQISSTRC
jgi:hypothetical protein